jgi:hypothetical protein
MTRYENLYDAMVNHQRDFTLVEIYRILCRPPHLRDPSRHIRIYVPTIP